MDTAGTEGTVGTEGSKRGSHVGSHRFFFGGTFIFVIFLILILVMVDS